MKSESKGLFYATLEREPRVLAYDNEGTDGGFIVTLVKGFAFYDAAETATDDPDGARDGIGEFTEGHERALASRAERSLGLRGGIDTMVRAYSANAMTGKNRSSKRSGFPAATKNISMKVKPTDMRRMNKLGDTRVLAATTNR